MNDDTKVYFTAGDTVTLKQSLAFKPKMVVKSVDKFDSNVTDGPRHLLGVTCLWFNTLLELQEHRFNTKDLTHCDE